MNNNAKLNRVDMLENMATDESVIFREFIRKFNGNEDKYFFLLEGDDDINYYNRPFENHFGPHKSSWMILICHGRSNVLEMIKNLKEHSEESYRKSFFFGFIDKDYNEVTDNLHKDKVYITPGYSIENFYASSDFIEKILERKFFVCKNDDSNGDFEKCYDNFLERRSEFIKLILELDMYLRCNRIMFEEQKIDAKLNAKDIGFSSSFSVDLKEVRLNKNSLEMLQKEIGYFDENSLVKAKSYYEDKDDTELASLIRGKFMFFFIHQYLFRLKEDNLKAKPSLFIDSYRLSKLPKPNKKSFKKTSLTLTKEKHDILSDLCSYSDIPSCLNDFLRFNVAPLRNELMAS
ncbi:DUF4435 domain-containing protein [Pantoea sp. SOD02]|uniref:DUF4435 domain-containing protein n=1 Tax=Pantoea sp. SOD02 TaxID=2970818 RepID=UPI0021582688|nr:DUF4435 domain-containing protein [Pantoea sp. SOD02]UVC32064.1 DUF4435 domain-containing protein [Pantoea sp. SOD02]